MRVTIGQSEAVIHKSCRINYTDDNFRVYIYIYCPLNDKSQRFDMIIQLNFVKSKIEKREREKIIGGRSLAGAPGHVIVAAAVADKKSWALTVKGGGNFIDPFGF